MGGWEDRRDWQLAVDRSGVTLSSGSRGLLEGWGRIGKYRLEIFFIGFWIGKSRREEWHVPLEPTAGAVLRDVAPGFSTFYEGHVVVL